MADTSFPTNLRALMEQNRDEIESLFEHALKNHYEKIGCGPEDSVMIAIVVSDGIERMTMSDPINIDLREFLKVRPVE